MCIDIRAREIHLEDLQRDIENLKNSHNNALDHKFQLSDDLENVHKQIDALHGHNTEVIKS